MGICAENTAKTLNISRQEQDDYALSSYKRSLTAYENKIFEKEIVPVTVHQKDKKSNLIIEDEEYKKINMDKFRHLPAAFQVLL